MDKNPEIGRFGIYPLTGLSGVLIRKGKKGDKAKKKKTTLRNIMTKMGSSNQTGQPG